MNKKVAVSAAIIGLAFWSGCTMRSDFTAISGKNVNLASLKIDRKLAKGKVKGEDCQRIIIFIPTSGPPTLSEALDQALESQHANLMLDAVTKYHWFYIPYIYGQACWTAEGVAYDTYQ